MIDSAIIKKMKKILFISILLIFFTKEAFSRDVEFVLYKEFLQKLMDKIFPIDLTGQSMPVYKIDIDSPVLSIYPKYIQLDSVVNLSSIFGNQTFPSKCKLVPVYNQVNNNIELKVIEGRVNLEFNSNGQLINLGVVDLSQYISNIEIPLKINNFNVKNKTVKTKCKNVVFELLGDRIIVNSDVIVD